MIKITCLSENSVKFGTGYWAEHGLSFFVETPERNFFIDAGASTEVLQHNLEIARLNFEDVDTLVISHGHFDHTNGLPVLLKNMKNPCIYAHPEIFAEHYAFSNEKYRYIGIQIEKETLENMCTLNLTEKPVEIGSGIYFSGEIPRKHFRAGKFYLRTESGYVTDQIVDDAAVYLSTPAGVLVVFGCGHAGVINTLEHAKQLTGRKIFGVFGGTHLVSASDEEIREVVEYLNAENVEIIRLSHCTGKKAEYMLQSAFGKKFAIFPCGEVEIVEF